MGKFKVSDIIKGIHPDRYGFTNNDMNKAEVLSVDDENMEIKVLNHKDKTWIGCTVDVENSNKYFALWEEPCTEQIHITIKGNSVHAVYKDENGVINRSEAKCNPEDKFDFKIGAKLAFDRLFENKKSNLKVGDYVKVIDNISWHRFEIGQIVKYVGTIDGVLKFEGTNKKQYCLVETDFEKYNPEMVFSKFKFIEDMGVDRYRNCNEWVGACHGKTERECKDVGHLVIKDWLVDKFEL